MHLFVKYGLKKENMSFQSYLKVTFDSQCRLTKNLVEDNNTAVIGGCITKNKKKNNEIESCL